MKKWFNLTFLFIALVFLPFKAFADGTITGTLTSPTTSIPISNATMTFTLSQAGVDVTNSYALATTPVTCATWNTGTIVGINDPLIAPLAVATNTAGGTLSGTYYLQLVYVDVTSGNTYPSPEISVSVGGGNNAIAISPPALHPARATEYRIYASTTSGGELYQDQSVGWGAISITSLTSGGALPTTNTTVCSLTFNDAIIPSYTSYAVNVVSSKGVNISGFPQSWYFSGNTINIGSILPIASSSVRFPTPILSNPNSNYATQSINSPLTLNGFALNSGILTASSTSSGDTALITNSGNTILRLLDTVNGTGTSHGLTIANGSTASGIAVKDNLPLLFATNDINRVGIDANGHISAITTQGTPAVAINAGTATLATNSNDTAGKITANNAGASVVTLTFGSAFSTAPSCIAQNNTSANILISTSSTTQLVLTGTTGSGDVISYHCIRFGS